MARFLWITCGSNVRRLLLLCRKPRHIWPLPFVAPESAKVAAIPPRPYQKRQSLNTTYSVLRLRLHSTSREQPDHPQQRTVDEHQSAVFVQAKASVQNP